VDEVMPWLFDDPEKRQLGGLPAGGSRVGGCCARATTGVLE